MDSLGGETEYHSPATTLGRTVGGADVKAVSLFSGAGGFCEGVRLAGFEIACAVEQDKYAAKTYTVNFPKTPLFNRDIKRFLLDDVLQIPGRTQLAKSDLDLVFGGPPCQGFSQIGPRNLKDPRNRLYREFTRVLDELRPKAFVMENVPNIVGMKNGHFRDLILASFKEAGYEAGIVLVSAADFGVPQIRKRVFFIGVRDDLVFSDDHMSLFTAALNKRKCERPVTVDQAISDLPRHVSRDDSELEYPRLGRGRCPDYQRVMRLDCDSDVLSADWKQANISRPFRLYNHHTKGIEARRQKIIRQVKPGGNGDTISRRLWKGTRAHKWRRLDPACPSYTILAQMHRDLSEWIHPRFDRWISVREAARLQSFHDGFVFQGSESQQLKQVGNAVPPLLALAVADSVRVLLSRAKVRSRGRK